MSKEDLCLKAANTISSLFRKAAATIDQLTAETSPWEGVFPHSLQFEERATENGVQLRYPLKDIAVVELEVVHDTTTVFLNINPWCEDYLIPSFAELSANRLVNSEENLAARFADLRWDEVSPDEARSFFHALNTHDGEHMWDARAGKLLGLMVTIARAKAQQTGKPVTYDIVRGLASLDVLVDELHSRRLPEHVANKLAQYLHDIPVYNEDDALNGSLSAKCYEQHGYLTMQIWNTLFWGKEGAVQRKYRLLATAIEHRSDAPISEVTARVEDGALVIDVVNVETRLKKVTIGA